MEDTISINHNWTNAFGVRHMWTHLQNELTLVSRFISTIFHCIRDFICGGGGVGPTVSTWYHCPGLDR